MSEEQMRKGVVGNEMRLMGGSFYGLKKRSWKYRYNQEMLFHKYQIFFLEAG